jgi:hypothetical protein
VTELSDTDAPTPFAPQTFASLLKYPKVSS